VESAGALFNVLLLLALGLLAVRVGRMAMAQASPRPEAVAAPGFGLCALAMCAATILNTTFVPKIAFTAYADTATAVTLAFCAGFLWFALNALAERRDEEARAYAWCTGFSATVLICLKQPNLVLFAAACIGALLVALRDRAIGIGRLVRLAPAALSLPVIAYGAWRLHVWAHIPDGEFAIRPMSGWFIDLLPRIVGQMALVASKKGGYFALMLASVALAVAGLVRMRGAGSRLAMLSASIFLIYNAFLLFMYVAAFDEMNALRAGSYWRYNTHVGGVALLFASFWTGGFLRYAAFRPLPRLGSAVMVVLVLATPIALSEKLRFDIEPRYRYARETAHSIAHLLSPKDRLLLIDPEDDGQYLVIMRYQLHGAAQIVGKIDAYDKPTTGSIARTASDHDVTHTWINAGSPMVARAFGLALDPEQSYLLARGPNGWSSMASWQHPQAAK